MANFTGGGLQDETVPGMPCVTPRASTECTVAVDEGTNEVVMAALEGRSKRGRRPALWYCNAARRIVAVLGPALGATSATSIVLTQCGPKP